MSHLRDLDSMILKNVLTQFLISCPRICIKKKKNHMLSKLKLKEKVMSKLVTSNGINIFWEMNLLFVIYSTGSSNQLCNAQSASEYQLLLIHFWWFRYLFQTQNGKKLKVISWNMILMKIIKTTNSN